MCEGLPQVAIIAAHLRAHGHGGVPPQEVCFYVDLFIHQGASRGGCDGGSGAVAAPPPQPAYGARKGHMRTLTLIKG